MTAPANDPTDNGMGDAWEGVEAMPLPNRLRDSYQREAEKPHAILATLLRGPELAEPLAPLEYLVHAMGLTAGSGPPHLVAGYGFSGKTLALQSLLLSLAAGRAVWGGNTGRTSRVLHVDLEQGRRLTQRRYQRLALAMGVNLTDLGDALAVAAMPRLSLAPEHRGAWVALMRGRDVALIDSLRAATGDLEENSSEMRKPLDMLTSISEETGCRTIIIHHARKPQKDTPAGKFSIRGSGAIFDACDGVYTFTAEKGDPVSVEHEKAREHGELVPGFALVISDVEADGDSKAGLRVQVHGSELVQERRDAKARTASKARARLDAVTLRKLLAAQPGLGSRAIKEQAGIPGDRLAAAKEALGAELEVRQEREGRTTRTAHYLRPQASGAT